MVKTDASPDQPLITLNKQLHTIDANLAKEVSFKRNLIMSIIRGAGYALGAGLIAAMIIAILNWTIKSVNDIPIVNKIFTPEDTTQLLQSVE